MASVLTSDGNVRPALVPYLRVSTDDKGQDPKRQLGVIGPWAEREGFILLKAEEDEISGSKFAALERPFFIRACERAEAAGAVGIVLESPDRFSRMDPLIAVWELVEIKHRYKLDVYFAGYPLDVQKTAMGKLVVFLQMASAHQWVVDHTSKVVSGMNRKRAEGVKFGRKPKNLTAEEILVVRKRRAEGVGWEILAIELNEARGVHRIVDKSVAYERMVSSGSLRRMEKEGVFKVRDGTTEGSNSGVPDEIISSPAGALLREEGISESGKGGS